MKLLERFEVAQNRQLSWAVDILTPLGLGFFSFLWASTTAQWTIAWASASALFVISLVLRRRFPLVMLVLAAIAGVYHAIVLPIPTPVLLGVPWAVYSVARWVPGKPARLAVVIGTIGSIVGPLRWTSDFHTADFGGALFFVLLVSLCLGVVLSSYVLARRVRETQISQQLQAAAMAERYQRILHARDQAARMAESKTRNEIARELHDIVAHSLSVIVVQAEGGKALSVKHPVKSTEALETIAETGRQALTEMRRIVGVLRLDNDQSPEYVPSPGLGNLPEMIAKSGDRVTYVPPATLPSVPSTLGLTVYRIVQESLTNFLKHAGPNARANVVVSTADGTLIVRVTDDGLGAAARSDGAGSGLKGMRERVFAMGGELRAGPKVGGGFEIWAAFPIPAQDPPNQPVFARGTA